MAETKLSSLLSKTTFEDVLDPTPKAPLAGTETKDVNLPPKPDDIVDNTPPNDPPKKDEPTEESFYESLAKTLGYEVEGEFEESVEGVAKYTKAVAEQIAQEEIKDLFNSYPDVKEYLQFRLNDGDPAKYF